MELMNTGKHGWRVALFAGATLVIGSACSGALAEPLPGRPAAGTRLVREWNGRMHVVEVTDDGFVWNGKSYRSLSAIAKRITGAHWSGPRFFNL